MNKSIIESSYALGVSKVYTIFKLILPLCKSDIISTITLAGGFAMGAAALYCINSSCYVAQSTKVSIFSGYGTPIYLYILTGEGILSLKEKSYGTALILIVILLIINFISMLLGMRERSIIR